MLVLLLLKSVEERVLDKPKCWLINKQLNTHTNKHTRFRVEFENGRMFQSFIGKALL